MTEHHILIVDDDDYSLHLFTQGLALHGYRNVECASRATDALKRLDNGSPVPDVVFCDLNMPELDGIQFIEALGGLQWDGSLVLVTGENARLLDAATQLAHSFGIQVLGRMTKPLDPVALVKLLGEHTAPEYPRVSSDRSDLIYDWTELLDAIDHDQLIVHYQPQVRLSDGAPSCLEALVRWRHPRDGLVYPENFISLAEDHGLIDALTEKVVKVAASQMQAWRNAGLRLPLSINLSMTSLQRLDAFEWLMSLFEGTDLSPGDVIWEITESGIIQDMPRTLCNVSRLALKHFSLSIDDFGTGHASLARLRDLPFSELKIDRSFVQNAAGDHARLAILDASVSLAKRLNMACVAEGVQSVQDWKLVNKLGCTHAQGWVIGRPQRSVSIPSWLERWPSEFDALKEEAGRL